MEEIKEGQKEWLLTRASPEELNEVGISEISKIEALTKQKASQLITQIKEKRLLPAQTPENKIKEWIEKGLEEGKEAVYTGKGRIPTGSVVQILQIKIYTSSPAYLGPERKRPGVLIKAKGGGIIVSGENLKPLE